ncbi:MAG: hydroxymethylbilane synthase [Gemmatimonadota bacterium]|nr:MAG: hydroxymethylbilane synthase [Gemmatimonadota bacterium]
MSGLRVGTRGSELALRQTDSVIERLRAVHPSLCVELVTIRTHGDIATDRGFDESWPVGAFVSALERALLDGRIDVAVHSYKDLQTRPTEGLAIAAVPVREAVHDVLLTNGPLRLEELPAGARLGTSSPRRAAQIQRLGDFEVIPVRGNVPTRIAKLQTDNLDGVILAAAGLRRLGIEHPCRIDLPPHSFVPAPGQGALAVQVRAGSEAAELVAMLDDAATRGAVTAERSFLRETNAGCRVPAGALAAVDGRKVSLHARLFSNDHSHDVDGVESGTDPETVGATLARRLLGELQRLS